MESGVWILVMVLHIGYGEVIIKPYKHYNNPDFGRYQCLMDKDAISERERVPMACIQEGAV